MKKILAVILLSLSANAGAMTFSTPDGTEIFKHSSVYSICQDAQGAIWMSCNSGLYRYNGHDLKCFSLPTMMRQFSCNGDGLFYLSSNTRILKFDSADGSIREIDPEGRKLYGSAFLAEGDSLIVGILNGLFVTKADTLCRLGTLPGRAVITSLMRTNSGKLIVGTQNVGIYEMDSSGRFDILYPLDKKVTGLFEDADRNIWAGLLEGGAVRIARSESGGTEADVFGENEMKEVRSFAADSKGNLFLGAVNGLFRIGRDDILREESISGIKGCAVCNVFIDRDDNLWVGTFYNGVHYHDSSFPFVQVETPKEINLINGLVKDSEGNLWATTDNNGLYRFSKSQNRWTNELRGSKMKFQGAYFDTESGMIWAGGYFSELAGIDPKTRRIRIYQIKDSPTNQISTVVQRVIRFNGELYLGCTNGIYLFDPGKEDFISRKISGFSDVVYDMETNDDSSLTVGSHGLFCCHSDKTVSQWPIPQIGNSSVNDISFGKDGAMWISAIGAGCFRIEGNSVTSVSEATGGFVGSTINSITPTGNGNVILCSQDGITILDCENWACRRYDKGSGLDYTPLLNKSVILQSGADEILIGGAESIIAFRIKHPEATETEFGIRIDRMLVNGEESRAERLDHTQRNLDFDITTFNYSNVSSYITEYRLENFDDAWHRFDERDRISFMNLSPGRYTFKVRAVKSGNNETFEDRISFRICPVWYESLPFKIAVIIIISLVIAFFWHSSTEKIKLSSQLKIKERESAERRRFFVELSYQMKHPVNLMIGQMEDFFRHHGSRTAGSEELQDVFSKALKIRDLISEYAEIQCEEIVRDEMDKDKPDTDTIESVSDSRFLNSAIGAVERKLYSQKITTIDLAADLNMGKTTLTNRLRDVCNKTPREFIEDIRLEHAAQMIEEGNLRISEIADSLNYGDSKYFSRCFKKKYGVLPSQYSSKK